MNYQISRIRLASVGPEPARFEPLDLDLANADGTGPADTVVFLPNTGGKTVLLRLLFSVLHPPIVERIGTEEVTGRSRNLTGYVLERDTAHVMIEWRKAEDGLFVDDEVLLTGLVAEWRGGRPTGQPGDLVRVWYSVRGIQESVGIDTVAVEAQADGDDGPVRRRLPLRRFREQLVEIAKRDRAIQVTITETQRDWIEHLESLGLDRVLFRYQGEMNHNEAGASAIARFTKDLDFIDFFLKAVVDPGELAVLDREFSEVADKARRFPEYERRLRFEEAALAEIEPLAADVQSAAVARDRAESARSAAISLLSRFVGANVVAQERESTERERERERDAEAQRLVAIADRHRAEAREFRKVGATLWLTEGEAAYEAAQGRRRTADLDVRAWAITEELVRLRDAEARVRALEDAYAAELNRLEPLRQARDEAALRLSRRLAGDAVLARESAASETERARDARARAARSRNEERDALVEAAKLDASRAADERRLAEIAGRRERLVGVGLLHADERTRDVLDREVKRAGDGVRRIATIEAEMAVLEKERTELDSSDRATAPRIESLRADHDRCVGAIETAERERERLATDPTVRELAESETFDLELIGTGLAERLLGRAAEADAARIDLELLGHGDRRALRGLDHDGLLPAPPEVEAALERLTSAGVVGAVAGTRYLADAIAGARREGVASRRADLAAGIVLTDAAELEKARSVLESAGLNPSMVIAVGPAAELTAVETRDDASPDVFVVPPAAAIWDRTAAREERLRLENRLTSLDDKRAALAARASTARSLADALSRHATAYPLGWLAARRAERDGLGAELDRLIRERDARDRRRLEIRERLHSLGGEATALRSDVADAERRAGELGRLAEDEQATEGLSTTIEKLAAMANEWRAVAADASRSTDFAEIEAQEAHATAAAQAAAEERIRRELATISLANRPDDPSPREAVELADSGIDLIGLRTRFTELDRRLTTQTSDSEVAIRRTAAIQNRDELGRSIEAHPLDVRERAAVLLAQPEAGDFVGRRTAAQRAETRASSAHSEEREAYSLREQARRALASVEDEIRASRRTVNLTADRMPSDRHHAARLEAESRENAEKTQGRVAEAERARLVAREAADVAQAFCDALAGLVTQLRMALDLADDARLPEAVPYDGDVEAARVAGLETSRRLKEALDQEARAEKAWRDRTDSVRGVLAAAEFADLAASDRLYRRLAQATAESLATDSLDLAIELRTSIDVLRSELATLSQDIDLAVTGLAKTVNKALSYLRQAEARSKMPATLRDWAGEPFLVIRFEKPPAEELKTRLTTFVADVINRPTSQRPTGTTLLLQALERAVGEFSVRILKPNEAFAPIRVPVTELSSPTFSNGQRSTVATALMLMLSELRRRSRSAARAAGVGALLLDNPFGNANAGFLIEVQRTVAAAAGIQLVYTTGIADFSALRHFPNVIALSNDAARRTMRKYVRANPDLLRLLVPEDHSPGGRLSAARVVAIPPTSVHRGS